MIILIIKIFFIFCINFEFSSTFEICSDFKKVTFIPNILGSHDIFITF